MDEKSDIGSGTPFETEAELCRNCLNTDFSAVFITPIPTFKELLSEAELPQSEEISPWEYSESCELCAEFDFASLNIRGDFDSFYLRAFPLPISVYQSNEVSNIVSPKRVVWLQPMPCGPDSRDPSILEGVTEQAQMTGWAACYPTADKPGMFRPRPVAKQFPSDLVTRWLMSCKQYHFHSCEASMVVPDLVLIDCDTLQLCRPPHQPPYIALSYVWGKANPGDKKSDPATIERSHLPPEDTLSQVVKDSISVTKQLGFRYLWIDKYCIDQSDIHVQNSQIENMDLIYMGAELTIIAAAGKDESYGLPGVGVERRAPRSVEIGDFTITHVPTEPWAISSYSVWATRAWTFQEELLSRRRLYFSEEQVFFICHGMLCCEARGSAELADGMQSMEKYSTASLLSANLRKLVFMARNIALTKPTSSGGFIESEKVRLRGFWELITEYSARDLTFDHDALRALAGICRVFEMGQPPIYDIQGLPVALCETPGMGCFLTNLVTALCWEHHDSEESRRRARFPSWTWVGWTRRIHFPYELEKSPVFEVTAQSILVEYEDGNRLTSKELADALNAVHARTTNQRKAHRSPQDSPNLGMTETTIRDITRPIAIHLHAPTITADLFSFTDPTDWATGSFTGMQLLTHRSLLSKTDMPFNPLFLLNGLVAGTLSCILLRVDRTHKWSQVQSKRPARAHLLLLQNHGATEAHRIGKLMAREREDDSFEIDKVIGALEWRNVRLV